MTTRRNPERESVAVLVVNAVFLRRFYALVRRTGERRIEDNKRVAVANSRTSRAKRPLVAVATVSCS